MVAPGQPYGYAGGHADYRLPRPRNLAGLDTQFVRAVGLLNVHAAVLDNKQKRIAFAGQRYLTVGIK